MVPLPGAMRTTTTILGFTLEAMLVVTVLVVLLITVALLESKLAT
ncbi:hypothetical protein [Streptomyces sioyaensis]